MITVENMFNNGTVNIFTDASITKRYDETIGCPGFVVIAGEEPYNEVSRGYQFLRHTTSNNSEITAILMGVQQAIIYKNLGYTYINLISDSKICIYGLREWMFDWVKNSKGKNELISSTGNPVANQDIILEIVRLIMDNNLHINFLHQNGHININNNKDLIKAEKTFRESNYLYDDIDIKLIKIISHHNDIVDKFTKEYLSMTEFKILPKSIPLFRRLYMEFDLDKYKFLIKGE